MTEGFAQDSDRQSAWAGYLRKERIGTVPSSFEAVMPVILDLIGLPFRAAGEGISFGLHWDQKVGGGGRRDRPWPGASRSWRPNIVCIARVGKSVPWSPRASSLVTTPESEPWRQVKASHTRMQTDVAMRSLRSHSRPARSALPSMTTLAIVG